MICHRVCIELTQRIITHTPDKGGIQTQGTCTGHSVRNSAAGCLHTFIHRVVENLGTRLFDKLHDAFFDAHQVKKAVIGLRNDIDNGVTDADQVVSLHSVLSSYGQRSRMIQVGHMGLRALQ